MDAPHDDHLIESLQKGLGVVPHAACIVVEDVLQAVALVLDLHQLVDLLLILDNGELDLGILQDENHFCRDSILIQRQRNAAQHLRRTHRPVETGTVVADDGQVVTALETEFRQAASHGANFFRDLAPVPGLPDAEIFFAGRRTVSPGHRVIQHQTGKSIERL